MTIVEVINSKLCIGCGFCAGVCPQSCIQMIWDKSKTWVPKINQDQCDDCGLCLKVCPNSVDSLKIAGMKSIKSEQMNGLNDKENNLFFISYDNSNGRISSASGGTTVRLLRHLLESGKVDFVVAARPRMAKIGEPHFETVICRSNEEINKCRSSAYGPLRYDIVLRQISQGKGTCAITTLPCIQRAIRNLPDKWRTYIKYTIGIVCSHNVTDQFADYMAYRHGISGNDSFYINYRDKNGISDANHFNTYFKFKNGKEIRTPRMENGFTPAWRNYWFAKECCLYCPDFYNAEADISIKDGWGQLSADPLGLSLCIVRNEEINNILHELKLKNQINLKECNADVIGNSQNNTARYKQLDFIHRWLQHSTLRESSDILSQQLSGDPVAIRDYFIKLRNARLTKSFFKGSSFPRYLVLILFLKIIKFQSKVIKRLKIISKVLIQMTRSFISYCLLLTKWGIPAKSHDNRSLRILITGGYGYQNVGDEAQLGANISRWKKLVPGCEIRVFSPDTTYTEKHHRVTSIRAPRIIWFKADQNTDYATSNRRFQRRFFNIKLRMVMSAHLMRMGLPALFCKPSEYIIINEIICADVLHVSGGGFLTGMTRSRLWENCLLMRLCHLIGTPVILTGQTIGVFKNKTDRKLAKWGLEHAKLIYLRDDKNSEADVNALGIKGPHIRSTFDDALFCEKATREEIDDTLKMNGIDSENPFITVNYHHWGQSSEVKAMSSMRFAESCDYIAKLTNTQILFIPMSPSDEFHEKSVINIMTKKATLLKYNYDYKIARGVIAQSKLIFTMKHHPIIFAYGEGVPVISVALDDYYYHKNKGAMDLVEQGNFCIDYKIFSDKNQTNELISHAWKLIDNNSAKIKAWTHNIKEKEKEAIKIFCRQNASV